MSTQLSYSAQLLGILIFYLLLGLLDTIHHLHAAFFLGHDSALHSAYVGIALIPIAVAMFLLYRHFKKTVYVATFLVIAGLAVLIPGIYHGGVYHVYSFIMVMFSLPGASTFGELLPLDNPHQWFYEITGIVEFILSVICLYYFYAYYLSKQTKLHI